VNRYACPVCAKTALFVRVLDRYVHVDGSENLTCWLASARGETTIPAGIPAASPEPPRSRVRG
jgi:hypothetical protein